LSLGNHGYNMTHTQNSLSFEHALVDAMLLLKEGQRNVLVGGADEHIEILDEIGMRLHLKQDRIFSSGASFFVLSATPPAHSSTALVDVETIGLCTDAFGAVETFFVRNGVTAVDIDTVLFADSALPAGLDAGMRRYFGHLEEESFVNYPVYSGCYATCSAFALHYAVDKVYADKRRGNVLIYNRLFNDNLGLMLLRRVEA
jgi:3-oxoacyl-[acyl-carrier-protein] synthase II